MKVNTWTAIPGPCMWPGIGAAGATLIPNMVITMVMTMLNDDDSELGDKVDDYDGNDGPPDSDDHWHLGILLLGPLHHFYLYFYPEEISISDGITLQWKFVLF